jgi:hypothetical protein
MKVISINMRGMGSPNKILSLHRLVEKEKLDIMLVQELMCRGI